MESDEYSVTQVAGNLDEVWDNFDPARTVEPESQFYVAREDDELGRLSFELRQLKSLVTFKAFLCGHGGSGKTTELKRLARDPAITERFLPVHVSVQAFGKDTVDLTHDALMVEICRGLIAAANENEIALPAQYDEELAEWGRSVTQTFLKHESAETEAGLKGNAWLAYFKAALRVRRQWNIEEQQHFEPRVLELIAIVDRVAQEIQNRSGRPVLVLVDDLEKGDSEGHRTMHLRLFGEHYESLVQPRFPVVYTVPVYFRALPTSRIPQDQLYTFAAARLYAALDKRSSQPPLDTEHAGYRLMRGYVERRINDSDSFFEPEAIDGLLLIGGGLFRETARAVRLATQKAIMTNATTVSLEHVKHAAQQIRKDYQPMVRGEAIEIFRKVMQTPVGWVDGVEPYLQSRAIVEYENGDLWLDVRSVLKDHVRDLSPT